MQKKVKQANGKTLQDLINFDPSFEGCFLLNEDNSTPLYGNVVLFSHSRLSCLYINDHALEFPIDFSVKQFVGVDERTQHLLLVAFHFFTS